MALSRKGPARGEGAITSAAMSVAAIDELPVSVRREASTRLAALQIFLDAALGFRVDRVPKFGMPRRQRAEIQ
jgi:hypothetical protein